MYLVSNYQVFQEKEKRLKNVPENLLVHIKRLKHLPKNHQFYMNMIHIIINPQVVEKFTINQTIRKTLLIRKKSIVR